MTEFDVFAAALREADPVKRAAFLDQACADDLKRRRRVEVLLKAHELADGFLEDAPPAPDVTGSITEGFGASRVPAPYVADGPGSRIGPYKLLQEIGEGGMGIVYMAEQETPVRRRVALKIIKPGMDSKQVVARFEAERQALAMMDHQNIARVLDAGTSGTGRPYFVMEIVHGVPISKYCDDAQLNPRERLELFIPVCQAIQHAHQKGIIHRDIKPSNVLVTLYDGKPVAKVIDFGIAKAIDQRLTERTMFTQFGSLVGTLEYMSPEQAEMSALGVDTRSDIYSLGVLLYELLTGSTPLESASLRQAGYAEIIKRIKEEEPPRPSTRLSQSNQALPSISSRRKTEPSKLASLVRGELDWIVMKALEKDRGRRYETASALARDIERHLNDETVEACPPSSAYRLLKFARRYRAPLAIASGFAFLLLTGIVASSWQAARARRAEREALVQRDEAARAQQYALDERDVAAAAERTAEAKRLEADVASRSLRTSLYVSDLQLAQAEWDSGNVARMNDLLEGEIPKPGEVDLRGFEWHYLKRLGSTVRTVKLGTGLGVMNRDGTRYVFHRSKKRQGPGAGNDIELELWDIASGKPLRGFVPFPGETLDTVFLPRFFSHDGKRMAYYGEVRDSAGQNHHRLKVWDWETGRELFGIADLDGSVSRFGACFNGRGERLAVFIERPGIAGGDLKIWEVETGKAILTIKLAGERAASIALSDDGTHLAALIVPAGRKGAKAASEIKVWEIGSGTEVSRFAGKSAWSNVEFSPDGRRLLVGGIRASSACFLDKKSGEEVLELAGGSGFWTFSPDGNHVAGYSADGKVRIWDIRPGDPATSRPPIRVIEISSLGIPDLGFSSDGRYFSSACAGTISTCEVTPPENRNVVSGPVSTGSIYPAASADGSRFAAAFEGRGTTEIKVWDVTGMVDFTASDASVGSQQAQRQVLLSRDGSRLAYSAWDRLRVDGKIKMQSRLRVWDIPARRELFHRDDEGGYYLSQDFRPDGRCLATWWVWNSFLSRPRSTWVSLWDVDTGKQQLRMDVSQSMASVGFSPDGRQLGGGLCFMTASDGDNELCVWNATVGEVALTRKMPHGQFRKVVYSSDGKLLAVAVSDGPTAGEIKVLDAASGRELNSLAGHRFPLDDIAFSHDGRRMASSSGAHRESASEIKLWDLTSGRELVKLSATGDCRLAFSPDGRRLCCVSGGNVKVATLQVWDATPLSDDRPTSSP